MAQCSKTDAKQGADADRKISDSASRLFLAKNIFLLP